MLPGRREVQLVQAGLALERTLARRVGEEAELVHCFGDEASGAEERTDPYRNCAPGPAG